MTNFTNLTKIGHWSFIGGLVLAALAAFIQVPYLASILFFLGLVVGFLNIKEKENSAFLIAVIALLVIGVAVLQNAQLGQVAPLIKAILNNFTMFVAAAGLVVAIKQVLVVGQS